MQSTTEEQPIDNSAAEAKHLQKEDQPMQSNDEIPIKPMAESAEEDVDLRCDSKGLHVRSKFLDEERFVPWDLPGICERCHTQIVDVYYTVQYWGIIIAATRLKKAIFIAFDRPDLLQKFSSFHLRYPIPNILDIKTSARLSAGKPHIYPISAKERKIPAVANHSYGVFIRYFCIFHDYFRFFL